MLRREFLKTATASSVIAGSGSLVRAAEFRSDVLNDAKYRELIRLHNKVRPGNVFWGRSPETPHATSVVSLYAFMAKEFSNPRDFSAYTPDYDESYVIEAYLGTAHTRMLENDLADFPEYMLPFAVDIRMMNLDAHVSTPEFLVPYGEVMRRYDV